MFNDVMGTKVCSATIIKAERECFQNLKRFEHTVKGEVNSFPVINCDETGMKVQRKKYWPHVASNDKYTFLFTQKEDPKQWML